MMDIKWGTNRLKHPAMPINPRSSSTFEGGFKFRIASVFDGAGLIPNRSKMKPRKSCGAKHQLHLAKFKERPA